MKIRKMIGYGLAIISLFKLGSCYERTNIERRYELVPKTQYQSIEKKLEFLDQKYKRLEEKLK